MKFWAAQLLRAMWPDLDHFKRALLTCAGAFGFVLLLGAVYRNGAHVMPHSSLDPESAVWIGVAVINSILAGIIIWSRGRAFWRERVFAKCSWREFMPAVTLLVGAALLTSISRFCFGDDLGSHEFGSPGMHGRVTWEMVGWVIWVSPIEEVVFRAGVGDFLRRMGGVWIGSYFSALAFSMVHTLPGFQDVLSGHLAIAWGPFFLGLACEYLYVRFGSLTPAVALHCAGNATVILFTLFDSRWFQWLRHLYL